MDAFETTVARSFADTERTVRAALADEGFGVLTEIDVAATLKAKLDIERAPLVILGACNPSFANRALDIDPTVALVLPCNVTLESTDAGTRVRAVDPRALMDDPRFVELAEEVAERLRAALARVSAS